MRFMLLLYVDDRPQPDTPEGADSFPAIMAYHQELERRGVLLGSDPLQDPDTATTVRIRAGQTLRTDGPFSETKEWLGGYFILDCRDLDEALELAARCPTAATGSVEVRPIMDVSGRAAER